MKKAKDGLWRYVRYCAAVAPFALLFWVCLVLVQSGVFPTSTGNTNPYEYSEFTLRVSEGGQTVYTAAENVTDAVYGEVMGKVYPDPETATEAVSSVELAGNPAFAHAVNICTHSSGKVFNQTGGGRHLTRFDGHRDNRHHTDTFHQVLTQNGYQTTDRFHYSVSRGYCGCG